jgi:hypothetical protein
MVLCKVTFGINFKVNEWDPYKEEETMNVTGTSNSQRTNANPINIEEDDVKGKVKAHEILMDSGPTKSPQN